MVSARSHDSGGELGLGLGLVFFLVLVFAQFFAWTFKQNMNIMNLFLSCVNECQPCSSYLPTLKLLVASVGQVKRRGKIM